MFWLLLLHFTAFSTSLENWTKLVEYFDLDLEIDDFDFCNNTEGEFNFEKVKVCKKLSPLKINRTIAHELIHVLQNLRITDHHQGCLFERKTLDVLLKKSDYVELLGNIYSENLTYIELEAHFLDNFPYTVFNMVTEYTKSKNVNSFIESFVKYINRKHTITIVDQHYDHDFYDTKLQISFIFIVFMNLVTFIPILFVVYNKWWKV